MEVLAAVLGALLAVAAALLARAWWLLRRATAARPVAAFAGGTASKRAVAGDGDADEEEGRLLAGGGGDSEGGGASGHGVGGSDPDGASSNRPSVDGGAGGVGVPVPLGGRRYSGGLLLESPRPPRGSPPADGGGKWGRGPGAASEAWPELGVVPQEVAHGRGGGPGGKPMLGERGDARQRRAVGVGIGVGVQAGDGLELAVGDSRPQVDSVSVQVGCPSSLRRSQSAQVGLAALDPNAGRPHTHVRSTSTSSFAVEPPAAPEVKTAEEVATSPMMADALTSPIQFPRQALETGAQTEAQHGTDVAVGGSRPLYVATDMAVSPMPAAAPQGRSFATQSSPLRLQAAATQASPVPARHTSTQSSPQGGFSAALSFRTSLPALIASIADLESHASCVALCDCLELPRPHFHDVVRAAVDSLRATESACIRFVSTLGLPALYALYGCISRSPIVSFPERGVSLLESARQEVPLTRAKPDRVEQALLRDSFLCAAAVHDHLDDALEANELPETLRKRVMEVLVGAVRFTEQSDLGSITQLLSVLRHTHRRGEHDSTVQEVTWFFVSTLLRGACSSPPSLLHIARMCVCLVEPDRHREDDRAEERSKDVQANLHNVTSCCIHSSPSPEWRNTILETLGCLVAQDEAACRGVVAACVVCAVEDPTNLDSSVCAVLRRCFIEDFDTAASVLHGGSLEVPSFVAVLGALHRASTSAHVAEDGLAQRLAEAYVSAADIAEPRAMHDSIRAQAAERGVVLPELPSRDAPSPLDGACASEESALCVTPHAAATFLRVACELAQNEHPSAGTVATQLSILVSSSVLPGHQVSAPLFVAALAVYMSQLSLTLSGDKDLSLALADGSSDTIAQIVQLACAWVVPGTTIEEIRDAWGLEEHEEDVWSVDDGFAASLTQKQRSQLSSQLAHSTNSLTGLNMHLHLVMAKFVQHLADASVGTVLNVVLPGLVALSRVRSTKAAAELGLEHLLHRASSIQSDDVVVESRVCETLAIPSVFSLNGYVELASRVARIGELAEDRLSAVKLAGFVRAAEQCSKHGETALATALARHVTSVRSSSVAAQWLSRATRLYSRDDVRIAELCLHCATALNSNASQHVLDLLSSAAHVCTSAEQGGVQTASVPLSTRVKFATVCQRESFCVALRQAAVTFLGSESEALHVLVGRLVAAVAMVIRNAVLQANSKKLGSAPHVVALVAPAFTDWLFKSSPSDVLAHSLGVVDARREESAPTSAAALLGAFAAIVELENVRSASQKTRPGVSRSGRVRSVVEGRAGSTGAGEPLQDASTSELAACSGVVTLLLGYCCSSFMGIRVPASIVEAAEGAVALLTGASKEELAAAIGKHRRSLEASNDASKHCQLIAHVEYSLLKRHIAVSPRTNMLRRQLVLCSHLLSQHMKHATEPDEFKIVQAANACLTAICTSRTAKPGGLSASKGLLAHDPALSGARSGASPSDVVRAALVQLAQAVMAVLSDAHSEIDTGTGGAASRGMPDWGTASQRVGLSTPKSKRQAWLDLASGLVSSTPDLYLQGAAPVFSAGDLRVLVSTAHSILGKVLFAGAGLGTAAPAPKTDPSLLEDARVRQAGSLLATVHKRNNQLRLLPADTLYIPALGVIFSRGDDKVGWLLDDRQRVRSTSDDGLRMVLKGLYRRSPFAYPLAVRVAVLQSQLPRDSKQSGKLLVDLVLLQRSDLLQSAVEEFQKRSRTTLALPMRVQFEGEVGIDVNGVRREAITLLSRELCGDELGVFVAGNDGSFFPGRDATSPSQLGVLRFAGQLFARVVAEGDVLDMRLSLFVVRRLLGRRPSVADLHTVDATLSEQLAWITDNSIDDVLYLNFAVEDPDTGEVIHELIAGGATREVTDANKREYVSAMVDYKLNYELEAQMQALLLGFASVLDPALIHPFSDNELLLMLCGSPTIEVDDMKRNSQFARGYDSTSREIVWLWEVLSDWTLADKSRLLQFVSGAARCPPGGFKSLDPPFTIQRVSKVVGSLPSASTCFNLLKLPEYSSKDELESKLLLAVHECTIGFAFS